MHHIVNVSLLNDVTTYVLCREGLLKGMDSSPQLINSYDLQCSVFIHAHWQEIPLYMVIHYQKMCCI